MYHCAKGCEDVCSGITKAIDSVCQCMCNSCEGVAKFLGKLFSRPFSFCVFMAVFVTILPGFAGFYGVAISEDPVCDPDITLNLLINSVNLFLIFIFCVYLCYNFGKELNNEDTKYAGGINKKEKNQCDRCTNMICYDPCTCIYCFLFVFFIGWAMYTISLESQVKSTDLCRDSDNNTMMLNIGYAQGVCVLGFVAFGFVVFFFSIVLESCDEGSCDLFNCCADCCCCCTLGICDMRKKKQLELKKSNQNQYYMQQRQAQPPQRRHWVSQGKNCCDLLGFRSKRRTGVNQNQRPQQYAVNHQQNPPPNQNFQMQQQNQMNQPQYNPQQQYQQNQQGRQQQQQQKKGGVMNKIKGWFT